MKVIKSKISYQSGKVKIQAIQCRPEINLAHPGIIILHGMEGFKAHHESFSEEIAREGYVVFAPQWFKDGVERKDPSEIELSDTFSMIRYLQSLEYVDRTQIGLVGFSLGATLSLIMAFYNKDIKVAILYYPPANWGQIGQFFSRIKIEPNFIESISCPLLIIQGDNDHIVPIKSAYKLFQNLKYNNRLCKMRVYPSVDHAFNWPDRKEYNAELAEKAREDTVRFLDKYLKSGSSW